MAAEFEAKTRLPFRPLSYEYIDLAYDKELIADYEKGNLYLKDANGNIIDLTQSISKLIVESGSISDNLTITIPGPDGTEIEVKVTEELVKLIEKINEQQKIIDQITGGSSSEPGGPTIIIQPGNIIQDETHQFINNTQFTEISNKVSIDDVLITIPVSGWGGTAAPYTQTVACVGAKADMARPTVDINHTDSETFDDAQKAEEEWCKIYRAKTGDNTITIYASEKPTVDLFAVVQLKQTGLTPNEEVNKGDTEPATPPEESTPDSEPTA